MSNTRKAPSTSLSILASPAYRKPVNPYTSQLYDELKKLGHTVCDLERLDFVRARPDILHVHWPEYGLNTPSRLKGLSRLWLKLLTASLIRRRGGKLIWTVHNLRPHEGFHPDLTKWFYSRWTALVDGAIALSERAHADALQEHPALAQVPFDVIPHGHYRATLDPRITRESARAELGFNEGDFVLGMVGNVRPYKQVSETLDLFHGLDGEHFRLLVAGGFADPNLRQEIEGKASQDDRVVLRLKGLSEAEFQTVTMACDVGLFNFSSILNSGSVLYALSCDVPVLAPRMGSLVELEFQEASEFVRLFDPPLTVGMLQVLSEGLTRGPVPLDYLDWSPLAQKTEALYREAMKTRRR